MRAIRIIPILLCLFVSAFLPSCANGNAGSDQTSSDNTTATADTTADTSASQTADTTAYDPAQHNYKNTKWDGKSLKVLAIGNSFSVDAMTYLYNIAKAEGVETVILGNLYIPSCTLQMHADNAKNNSTAYIYYKNTSGTWAKTENATLLHGLTDEKWDIITMQQASGYSGVATSYADHLADLVDYVNRNKTNAAAQLAWHMTWAYQQNSTHSQFATYDKDQMKMYNQILGAVQTRVLSSDAFSIVIPAGTAIQNTRTSYYGDTLTRDGYHLSELGRFIAGYTWFASLTGRELSELKCKPPALTLSESDAEVILESVTNAKKTLFGVTPSKFTEAPPLDLSKYTRLDFQYTVGAYWNSTNATQYDKLIADASNSKYYIATVLFTKETLPAGSVIVVDKDWQYRPEKWTTLTKQSARDNPTTQNIFIVTESWWNGYAYRAFNISKVQTADITKDPTAITHFKIYVPKT